jgi:asparagine synthase (glutamine-hydrolysing)
MARLQDEPIADPVCVPVYYVSKLARDAGVIVCQVGEGADELFWGYPSWKTTLRREHANAWPVPRALKRAGVAALEMAGLGGRQATESLRRGALGLPLFWSGAEAFTEHQKQELLSARLRDRYRGRTSWEAIRPMRERFEARAWERSPLAWMTYADLSLRLPELLLMRVDKMSMGVSLEARVPFLDHKLVELAMGIPAAAKTRNGTLKHILKKAVRGLIPDAIIERPKQGFGVPIDEWFLDRLGPAIRSELDAFCRKTDHLDRAAVERLLAAGNANRIWYLYNLALWWKEYLG